MKKNGFTLIEILIVVAIIGLLSTMGLMAFQKSLQRSRDARRISEIKALQGAAEQYYADQLPNAYPVTNDCANLDDYVQGFNGVYEGPRGDDYVCQFGGTSYCISADLEGDNGNCDAACGGVPGMGGSGFFCVNNLF